MMTSLSTPAVLLHLLLLLSPAAAAFTVTGHATALTAAAAATTTAPTSALFSTKERETSSPEKKDNQAMAFLRRKGLVGGNKDFTNVLGIDEGPAGKAASNNGKMRKAKAAYQSCVVSGVIDDFSNDFPLTSFGSEWSGYSDRVMGGISMGSLEREVVQDRPCNVLRGSVVPLEETNKNNKKDGGTGFIQMATELALDPSVSKLVDASEYDGIELDVLCKAASENGLETFNVHLKTPACQTFDAYRSTFEVTSNSNKWETVRIPWSDFVGYGTGAESEDFNPSELRRVGIVAIGREMDVNLCVSNLGFYSVF